MRLECIFRVFFGLCTVGSVVGCWLRERSYDNSCNFASLPGDLRNSIFLLLLWFRYLRPTTLNWNEDNSKHQQFLSEYYWRVLWEGSSSLTILDGQPSLGLPLDLSIVDYNRLESINYPFDFIRWLNYPIEA